MTPTPPKRHSLCGFAIFCVVLALTLPRLAIAGSFAAALVTQLVLQTWLFRRVWR